MFKSFSKPASKQVVVYINGQKKQVTAGISVAAAVLEHQLEYTRTTPISNAKRLPFCMMGVCYDCLMVINNIPNQRACSCIVHDGMRIDIQNKVGPELLRENKVNE